MPEAGRVVSNYTMYLFGKEKYLKALLRSGRITQEQYQRMERFLYERFQIAAIGEDLEYLPVSLPSEPIVSEENAAPVQTVNLPAQSIPAATSVPNLPVPEDIEYVSLTQLAREYNPENPGYVIQLWLQNQNTIEFLRLWEETNNPRFNRLVYEDIQAKLRTNAFTLTAKYWIEQTGAIGLQSKSGRYGGTFAHPMLACEFLTGLSPRFKLTLIEMTRLADTFPERLGDGDAWRQQDNHGDSGKPDTS